jgi:hypothetical protein
MESPIPLSFCLIPTPLFLSRFYLFFHPYPFSIPILFLHNHKYKHSSEVLLSFIITFMARLIVLIRILTSLPVF